MSFLDNAGTIILDAILTDLGRKRMAQGNFDVRKFSLGDDEVDYALYNKVANEQGVSKTNNNLYENNADAGILSQSCFEALNQSSAVINYGLTSFERPDLLYIPTLKINYSGSYTGTADSSVAKYPEENSGFARPYNGLFYLAVNKETTNKLKSAIGNTNYILENSGESNTKLVIESGINSNEVAATIENRDSYILRMGLLDSYYLIYADSRFFTHILGPAKDSHFKNNMTGDLLENFGPLKPSTQVSLETIIDKFNTYIVEGIHNHVYSRSQGRNPQEISAVLGAKGSVVALGFMVPNSIGGNSTTTRDQKYTIFGATDQTLFGGSDKYDYIDTTIYVEGTTTNARVQVPVRIIRYAGT